MIAIEPKNFYCKDAGGTDIYISRDHKSCFPEKKKKGYMLVPNDELI